MCKNRRVRIARAGALIRPFLPSTAIPSFVALNVEMAISLARVSIVSIFVECILYGFFTFMFAVSVYVLLIKRRSKTETVNRPLLVVSITMFILATIVS